MNSPIDLNSFNADQLRELAAQLMTRVAEKDEEIRFKDTRIAQLTHEMAVLKRLKFAARSEKFDSEQQSLLDEAIDADIAAIEHELEALSSRPKEPSAKTKPRRAPLPANLARIDIAHEPDSSTCTCGCELKRIGEDVSEKLDYTPGVFTVERHIRGKWVCAKCETLIQAPVPAQVIDKGIPTAGLLAQVLVSKYGDHVPLYRQERIFERAGLAIPRSTLGQWIGQCGVQLQPLVDALRQAILGHRVLHADETPVAMLSPGKGKTQRAFLWTYCPGAFEDPPAATTSPFAVSFGPSRLTRTRRVRRWGRAIASGAASRSASNERTASRPSCTPGAIQSFARYADLC
jgi:transposase